MKVFWFLSGFSARPDGSTVMINLHHKLLLKNDILSFVVSQATILWLKIPNIITLYLAVRMIKDDDLLLTSWDDTLLTILKFPKGKKIAYLQSHFANSPWRYKVPNPIITVSNFAAGFIKRLHGKDPIVLLNVVSVGLQPIRFNQKKDVIYVALPRRDHDILLSFAKNTKLNLRGGKFTDRKTFLSNLNQCKFFLSHYRLDAFGLPPILAMALGTIPIIFTNTTGRDYREHMKNRLVFDPSRAGLWTDLFILKIDKQKLLLMSANGIWTARKYLKSNAVNVLKRIARE